MTEHTASQATPNIPQPIQTSEWLTLFKQAFPPSRTRWIELTRYDALTGNKTTVTHREALTDIELLRHLETTNHSGRIGYQPGNEEKTNCAALDVDNKQRPQEDADADLTRIKNALKSLGIIYYVETSTNGGYHVWIFSHEEMRYDDMRYFLEHVKRKADLVKTETYPSQSGAEGRHIYLPYAGALKDPNYLGSTYLRDADQNPIPITQLGSLKRNNGGRLTDLAKDEMQLQATEQENFTNEVGALRDLAPEAFDDIAKALLRPPRDFQRHSSIVAALNIFDRANRLEQGVELLKSRDLYAAWVTDNTRTYKEWHKEIDRWLTVVQEVQDPDRNRYGLKFLIEQGFKIGKLKASVEAVLSKTSLSKLPDRDLAEVLSRAMRAEGEFIFYDPTAASFFRYDGITFIPDDSDEDAVKRWIGKYLDRYGKSLSEGKLTSVTSTLVRDFLSRPLFREQAPHLIACYNGVFNWQEGKLYPHSPEHLTIGCVNANYSPELNREGNWTRYLETAFKGAGEESYITAIEETLSEFCGYVMLPLTANVVTRHILNLHGPSSTGKSTTWKVLLSILGDASSGNPRALGLATDQSLFDAQDWGLRLVGRRVVAFDELTTGDPRTGRKIVNLLKILAGDSPVRVNPKGKKSVTTQLGCRILICTNYDLRIYEDSGNDAMFRRLLRLPYNNVVDRLTERGSYEARILDSQEEKDKVFMWMLDGLARLKANEWHFKHAQTLARELEDAREEANPIIPFLREHCIVGEGLKTTVGVLRTNYLSWSAEVQGRGSKLNHTSFTKKLRDAVSYLGLDKQGVKEYKSGARYWLNLGFPVDLVTKA